MKAITTSLAQTILNKSNQKQNFTYNLSNSKNRYIVSFKNLYTGKNPSLDFNLITKVDKFINSKMYDSLGGWLNKETNLYYLDANLHFSDISIALKVAKNNNQIAIFDNLKKETIYLTKNI